MAKMTKRELRLLNNPTQNTNKGFGGYWKYWHFGDWLGSIDNPSGEWVWFWRDKPYQSRKRK